tara:strand:- start:4179 stop:5132 length:954 start_codon:yes stop_codon:yes gene_type:complete
LSRILVTGGAGFIGTNLIKSLINDYDEIIIFDNEFRGSFSNFLSGKTMQIKGDITKYSDWDKLPNDIETVFHLGAINGTEFFYEIPEKVLEVNVKGVQNLVDFSRKRDIEDIVFASSSEVYGFPKSFPTSENTELSIPDPYNPRFSYSSSKIIGELLCINYSKKYNFKHTIVRYHNIYGPKMGHEHVMPQFIKKLTYNEKFIVEGDGTETRSFCYIDDAIEATRLVHKDNTFKNRIFNIGNSEEVSISKLIKYLIQISGKKIVPEFKEKINFGTKRRVPDITKAQSLGYTPKISLKEGFEITYDWYNEYYKNKGNRN